MVDIDKVTNMFYYIFPVAPISSPYIKEARMRLNKVLLLLQAEEFRSNEDFQNTLHIAGLRTVENFQVPIFGRLWVRSTEYVTVLYKGRRISWPNLREFVDSRKKPMWVLATGEVSAQDGGERCAEKKGKKFSVSWEFEMDCTVIEFLDRSEVHIAK